MAGDEVTGPRLAGRHSRNVPLLLAIVLVAILFDVFATGSTALPHLLSGVMPTGPYGYSGHRPAQIHAISVDPAGAYQDEFAWGGFFVRSIRHGTFPFWNPYQGLGQPQLANGVPALLAPVNWLGVILPPAWWDLIGIVDWWLAAFFCYLVARVMRIRRPGALIGALSVFAAGFFPAFLEVRSIVGTVAWFPCLIYAIERALRQPQWRLKTVVLAVGTYGLATGGHPSPAVFSLVAALMFLALRLVAIRHVRAGVLAGILAPVALGGLLAAPFLLPFAEHVLWDSLRTHAPGRGLGHFPWQALPQMVFPNVYGPLNHTIWGVAHAGVTWLPASVACLAILGLARLRWRSALAALVIPAALIGAKNFGLPIVSELGRLPLFDQLTITYSLGIVVLVAAVVAGHGAASIVGEPLSRSRTGLILWTVYVALMAAIAVWTVRDASAHTSIAPWLLTHHAQALGFGVFWAIAFPAALVLLKRRRPHNVRRLIVVASSGVVLQAAACFPAGSPEAFVLLQTIAGTAFVVAVAAAILVPDRVVNRATWMTAPALTALAVAAATAISPRLPDRHDGLARAPYLDFLAAQSNAPRLHPLEGVLAPTFASSFGLSSITNLDNLITREGAAFITTFLDRGVFPARFFGQNIMRHPERPDPLAEFWAHKKYWDLIGLRYVLTSHRDANESPPRPGDPSTPPLTRVYRQEHQTYRRLRDPAVTIWENTAAFDRAFLAPVAIPVSSSDAAMRRLAETADLRHTAFVEFGSCAAAEGPPADSVPGRLVSLDLSPNRVDIRYDSAVPGVLVLTDAHARGWRATVSGQAVPLLRVDGVFRGVCLDRPGVHDVSFVYRPPHWGLAMALCGVGAMGLAGLVLTGRARRRRRVRT